MERTRLATLEIIEIQLNFFGDGPQALEHFECCVM